jgi:HEAT repeat protein
VPTPTEELVLRILSATDWPINPADRIEELGPEAVNVACEAALGTYVGLRPKIRTNAAAIVGDLDNEQARETLALLITDANEDVAIRAMRAVGRRDDPELIERVAIVLRRPETSPLLAAEAVDALIKTPARDAAQAALDAYRTAGDEAALPHRRHQLVQEALERSH